MIRNTHFRYLEDVPARDEQLENIRNILRRAYGDLSELADLVDDESADHEPKDQSLAE
jgi:hypothetical protein